MNNEAFLALVNSIGGGLSVEVNVMTSPQVYTIVFVNLDILNLVAAAFSLLMAMMVYLYMVSHILLKIYKCLASI